MRTLGLDNRQLSLRDAPSRYRDARYEDALQTIADDDPRVAHPTSLLHIPRHKVTDTQAAHSTLLSQNCMCVNSYNYRRWAYT